MKRLRDAIRDNLKDKHTGSKPTIEIDKSERVYKTLSEYFGTTP
jgi:hypothetical protein